MQAVEFTAELSGSRTLTIPPEAAAQLPAAGTARIIVLTAGRVPSAAHVTPEDGGSLSLAELADHAEPMGSLTNSEIDRAIYGG